MGLGARIGVDDPFGQIHRRSGVARGRTGGSNRRRCRGPVGSHLAGGIERIRCR
jgi:hypothetical protein